MADCEIRNAEAKLRGGLRSEIADQKSAAFGRHGDLRRAGEDRESKEKGIAAGCVAHNLRCAA